MARSLRVAWGTLAGLLLLALPAVAQVQFGDFSTDLNGTLSAGYTDAYGNLMNSNHSWTVGGSGTFSGYYYNPNFISFTASPYLNQSRANSDFQSISDASGVNFSSSIFGGSHFPGSISYAKAYNSEGNYGIPGISSFTTKGNSDTFGINWSEMLPDAPSVSVGFQRGSNQYSIYGSNDQGSSDFHSFNIHSAYTLEGFNLSAFYSTGAGTALIPQVANLQEAAETHSGGSDYGFNVGHKLPLRGMWSAGINRADIGSDYSGYNYNATIDTINTLAMVQPTDKLHVSFTANYSDNLEGQLYQSVINAGGIVSGANSNQASHSMDYMGTVSYAFLPNLQTSAFAERRTQYFLGESFGGNSYGGSANYGHGLLGGVLNVAGTVSENTVDNSSASALGFSGTVNYSRRIFGWAVSGSFNYAQNVQTVLISYTNSFYNYSGSIRHRWGKISFGAGAGGGRTGITAQPGTDSRSESYNASFGYSRWITLTGGYSKASGEALATTGGLVPIPIPQPILPLSDVTLYGGHSYSFGLGSNPAKKLTLAAAYSKANSNTFSNSFSSCAFTS